MQVLRSSLRSSSPSLSREDTPFYNVEVGVIASTFVSQCSASILCTVLDVNITFDGRPFPG